MTREQYQQLPGINFSTLKHILRSPAHMQAERDNLEPEDPTRFAVGTLAHSIVLEGKNMLDLYAVKPLGMSSASKEGKAWKAEQTKPILTYDEAAGIPAMAEKIAKTPTAAQLIRGCSEREVVLRAVIDGVECKGIIDMLGKLKGDGYAFGDFKTTTDAREPAWQKKVETLHYDLQLAKYERLIMAAHGCPPPYIFWIVQETSAPYEVQVYVPTESMMERGRQKLAKALALYKQCTASGEWPGYGQQINQLAPVAWARPIEDI